MLLRVESEDSLVDLHPIEMDREYSCSPLQHEFRCTKGAQKDALLLPTTLGQIYYVGLMGYNTHQKNASSSLPPPPPTYTLQTNWYPVGNLYNDTTYLGVVGNESVSAIDISLEEEGSTFVYKTHNNYNCMDRGHGPGRVYTMTIAQSGTVHVMVNSSESSWSQALQVDLMGNSDYSCNHYPKRFVEAGDLVHLIVFATVPKNYNAITPIATSGTLQIRMELEEPLCNLWKQTLLGEIGMSGIKLRGTIVLHARARRKCGAITSAPTCACLLCAHILYCHLCTFSVLALLEVGSRDLQADAAMVAVKTAQADLSSYSETYLASLPLA